MHLGKGGSRLCLLIGEIPEKLQYLSEHRQRQNIEPTIEASHYEALYEEIEHVVREQV